MPFRLIRLFIISAYVFTDTASTIYRRFQVDECDRVSYTAHIAGAVTGVLMGVVILHNLKVNGTALNNKCLQIEPIYFIL